MEEPSSKEGHIGDGVRLEAKVLIIVRMNLRNEILLKGRNVTPTGMSKGTLVFLPSCLCFFNVSMWF